MFCTASLAQAQEQSTTASANDYLNANKKTDRTLVFNTNAEGIKTPVIWGLDTAWPSEDNVLRGTNHIGKEHLGVGRVSFQASDLVDANGELSSKQKRALDNRLRIIALSGVKDIALNSDHEVLCDGDANAAQHRANYVGKPAEWVRMFKATVNYCRDKGFNVVSIAPFNEADYTAWNQGTMADFKEICRLIKDDEFFDGIRVSGGNTLNCDEALKWYNGLNPYLDEGNTHQLAGSFDNYAKFFETVRANGHHATADELHNVMEAIVGVEYGMQTGIWWGYDGRARGQFCQATSGERLAYAEDRPHWTGAAVYRMPDGRIQAFGGTSERQANTSSYLIVSQDKVAYFDGHGPMHEYLMELPGGSGYQDGQTNAERVLEIHTGEDVPLGPTEGKFIIVNKNSHKLLMPANGNTSNRTNISQGGNKKQTYQQWNITPVDSRIGGDFSYFFISNVKNEAQLDILNWSTSNGGSIILYAGAKGTNEQWYFQYAGDGYYYIISRHSGLCLEVSGASTNENANVVQNAMKGTDSQLWRLLPVDVDFDKIAPNTPTGLEATPTGSTIKLTWNANTDKDIAGYCVLRATAPDGEWNTIARNITDTTFVDNTVSAKQEYVYKLRSIDKSLNRSKASEVVSASTLENKEEILAYEFESNLEDRTGNLMHCVHYGKATYGKGKIGDKAIQLDGNADFIQLPTAIAHRDEMTISLWIKWGSSSSSTKWQRIFDFGNGEDQYMYLTTSTDKNVMRLAAKDGDKEQFMNIGRLTSTWKHITITINKDCIVAYIDGEEKETSNEITIRPADFKPVCNYIGRGQSSSIPLLKADIDEVRVFNYALSAAEVKKLYETNTTKIEECKTAPAEVVEVRYYTLDGMCHDTPQQGFNIVRTQYSDGSVTVEKTLSTQR